MKRIPLTQGKEALVSDCDYKYLMRWKWWYNKHHGNGGYAIRKIGDRKVYMHKVVASRKGLPPGQVDHKNQNKLDNQRGNLRSATNSQNKANGKLYANNTSGYKGVTWYKSTNKWHAQITAFGKVISLGYFPGTEAGKRAAARCYNKAAKKYFKERACLNKV